MKGIILLAVLFAFYQISYAQCDKKIAFKCEKARSFKNGTVGQELPIYATISIENGKIFLTATLNGESETAEGEITEVVTCEWTEFLKNGRTQYKAVIKKGNQNPENGIMDIQSDNGYTKITFGSDPDTGSKLQFDVSEYVIAADAGANISTGTAEKKNKKSKKRTKQQIAVTN